MASTNWQLQCATMKDRGAYLYKSKLWSDCSFQLSDEVIKAHKLILAMASPVFAKAFYGETVHKCPISLYGLRPEIFKSILEYIYSDDISINSMKDACDIYAVAKKWRLPFVERESLQYCLGNLTPDNVTQFYEMGLRNSEHLVRASCVKIFKIKTKEVLKNSNFCKAKLSTVLKIFSLDYLNIDSELDLFEAAVRYADAVDQSVAHTTSEITTSEERHELEEQDSRNSEDEGPPPKRPRIDESIDIPEHDLTIKKSESMLLAEENNSAPNLTYTTDRCFRDIDMDIRTQMKGHESMDTVKENIVRSDRAKLKYRCLLQKVRFLTLTPQEFAECGTLSSLLTESEMLALSMNISSNDTNWPMPEGFSRSSLPRKLSMKEELSRLKASFHSTIHNMNESFKKYESIPFYIRNLPWTLLMFRSSSPCWVVIAITCFYDEDPPDWIPLVSCKVKFSTREDVPHNIRKMTFNTGESSPEYYTWIAKMKWSDLIDPDNGFVKNDTLTYSVDVNTCKRSPKIKVKDTVDTLAAKDATNTLESTAVTPETTNNPVTKTDTEKLDTKTTATSAITPGPLIAGLKTASITSVATPILNINVTQCNTTSVDARTETPNSSISSNTTLTATVSRISTTVNPSSETPSSSNSSTLTSPPIQKAASNFNTLPSTPKASHTAPVKSTSISNTNIPLSSIIISQKFENVVNTPANTSTASMDQTNTPQTCDLSCDVSATNTSAVLSETRNLGTLFSTPVPKLAPLLDDTLPSYDIKTLMSPSICDTPLSKNSTLDKTPILHDTTDDLSLPSDMPEAKEETSNKSLDVKVSPETKVSSFVNNDSPSASIVKQSCENETKLTSSMDTT